MKCERDNLNERKPNEEKRGGGGGGEEKEEDVKDECAGGMEEGMGMAAGER